MNTIRDFLFAGNLEGLVSILSDHPELASEAISLPDNPTKAYPLHRICDAVSAGHLPEETGVQIAKLFISIGGNVNSECQSGKDSPLTAACSLGCDMLALLYLQQGARIDHKGCHGGTALHWAAWRGRDTVVQKLLSMNANINELCMEFKSTPLFWAMHGYRFGGRENRHHQVACARLLIYHGADPSIPNFEGLLPAQLAGDNQELVQLFKINRYET